MKNKNIISPDSSDAKILKSKKLFTVIISIMLALILISGFIITGVLTYPAFLDPMAPYRQQAISEFDIREDCNVYSVSHGYFLVDDDGMAATARANSNLTLSADGKSVVPAVGEYGWVKFCFNSESAGTVQISVRVSRDTGGFKLTDYYSIMLNNETLDSDAVFNTYSKRDTGQFDEYVLGEFAVKEGVNVIRFECKPIKKGGAANEYTVKDNVLYGFSEMTLSGTAKYQWATYANMRTRSGHRLLYMLGKDATCSHEGSHPYYKCLDDGCGKLFSDDMATVEISAPEKINIDSGAHSSALAPADCTQTAVCSLCGKTYHGAHTLGALDFDKKAMANDETKIQAVQKLSCNHCGAAKAFTITNANKRRPENDVKVENPGVPAGTAKVTRIHTGQETLWTDSKEITLEDGSKMMSGGRVTLNVYSETAKTVDIYLALSCPPEAGARVSDAFTVALNGSEITSKDCYKELRMYDSDNSNGINRFYEYYQYRIGVATLVAGTNSFVIDQMTTDMIPTATKTVYLKGLYMLGDAQGVVWSSEQGQTPVDPDEPDEPWTPDQYSLTFGELTASDRHALSNGQAEAVQKYTVPASTEAKSFYVTDGNSLRPTSDVLLKDIIRGDESVNTNPKDDKLNANYETFHAERGCQSTLEININSDVTAEVEFYIYVSCCSNNNGSIALSDIYSVYSGDKKMTSDTFEHTDTVAPKSGELTADRLYFEYYGYYVGKLSLTEGTNTVEIKHHSPSLADGGKNGNYLKGFILAGDVDGVTWASGADSSIEPEPEAELSSIEITEEPSKLEYTVGESFDPTGMEVTAHYTEGKASTAVSGYTWSPNGQLTADDTVITISYSEGGITKTVNVTITVTNVAEPEPETSEQLLEFLAFSESDRNQIGNVGAEAVQKYNVSAPATAKDFYITDGNSLRPTSDVLLKNIVRGDVSENTNPKDDKLNASYQALQAERGCSSTMEINLWSDVETEAEIYLYVSCCASSGRSLNLRDLYSVYRNGIQVTSESYESAVTVPLKSEELTADKLQFEYYGYYIGKISLSEGMNTIEIKHHAPSQSDGGQNGNYFKGFVLAGDVDGITWASQSTAV